MKTTNELNLEAPTYRRFLALNWASFYGFFVGLGLMPASEFSILPLVVCPIGFFLTAKKLRGKNPLKTHSQWLVAASVLGVVGFTAAAFAARTSETSWTVIASLAIVSSFGAACRSHSTLPTLIKH